MGKSFASFPVGADVSITRPLVGSMPRIAPAGKTVAAGHHVDQVERLDRSFGNLADEIGRFGGQPQHDHGDCHCRAAATLLHAGRFVLVQDLGIAFRLSIVDSHLQL